MKRIFSALLLIIVFSVGFIIFDVSYQLSYNTYPCEKQVTVLEGQEVLLWGKYPTTISVSSEDSFVLAHYEDNGGYNGESTVVNPDFVPTINQYVIADLEVADNAVIVRTSSSVQLRATGCEKISLVTQDENMDEVRQAASKNSLKKVTNTNLLVGYVIAVLLYEVLQGWVRNRSDK